MKKLIHLAMTLISATSLTTAGFAGRGSTEPAPSAPAAPTTPVPIPVPNPLPPATEATDPEDSSNNDDSQNTKGYSSGKIAAITAGTAAGIAAIGAAGTVALRKKFKDNAQKQQPNEASQSSIPLQEAVSLSSPVPNNDHVVQQDNFNLHNDEPLPQTELAELQRAHEENVDQIVQKHGLENDPVVKEMANYAKNTYIHGIKAVKYDVETHGAVYNELRDAARHHKVTKILFQEPDLRHDAVVQKMAEHTRNLNTEEYLKVKNSEHYIPEHHKNFHHQFKGVFRAHGKQL